MRTADKAGLYIGEIASRTGKPRWHVQQIVENYVKFRPSKSTVFIAAEDVSEIERRLAEPVDLLSPPPLNRELAERLEKLDEQEIR